MATFRRDDSLKGLTEKLLFRGCALLQQKDVNEEPVQ